MEFTSNHHSRHTGQSFEFWTVYLIYGAGVLLLCLNTAWAAVYELTPSDDWFCRIGYCGSSQLSPGDEVILHGGIYSDSRRLSLRHIGTAAQPIMIRAFEDEVPIITRPDANQNTINIEGSQHLILCGLEVTGGSIGIRMGNSSNGTSCRFVTIEDCHVHHTGGVAISANYNTHTYEGIVIRHNEIHHAGGTGEGLYLGCNNGDCEFFNGIIEKNYIHDLTGVTQGDGIEIKHGSYNNIVRENVIHDTDYPGIIVYGTSGHQPNMIERNVIWRAGDHGIQAAADAVIRNNIIIAPDEDGIRCQPHQGAVPGNLTIVHNTIVASLSALRIRPDAQGQISGPILIANNALYSQKAYGLYAPSVPNVVISGNIGSGGHCCLNGADCQNCSGWNDSGSLVSDFMDVDWKGNKLDVYPAPASVLVGSADFNYLTPDDFNGDHRDNTLDVGAYRYCDDGNPGWTITPGFKTTLNP